jgi:hypothetical protein
MQVLYFNEKGTPLDTVEIFCIYKEAATDNQLSDRHIVCSSKIFKAIISKGKK